MQLRKKDPSLGTKFLSLHPSNGAGRIGDLEMLNIPDLPFLYLQSEKSNSYLLTVGERLNEVIDIDYRG